MSYDLQYKLIRPFKMIKKTSKVRLLSKKSQGFAQIKKSNKGNQHILIKTTTTS